MPAAICCFHSNNHSQHLEHLAAVINGPQKILSVMRKEAGLVPVMAMASKTTLGSLVVHSCIAWLVGIDGTQMLAAC
jgi:hypothetical protein